MKETISEIDAAEEQHAVALRFNQRERRLTGQDFVEAGSSPWMDASCGSRAADQQCSGRQPASPVQEEAASQRYFQQKWVGGGLRPARVRIWLMRAVARLAAGE